MASWLLIDDSPEEAAAFATRLSQENTLPIDRISAHDAASALRGGAFAPAGVLMDVDLSNEMGNQQTGPGMSQDMRVAQQRKQIPAFPIVRFSLRNKVIESIGNDSSSDDIFDLKIEKDGLSEHSICAAAQSKLLGVRKIYDALDSGVDNLPRILGLDADQWSRWGSSAFEADFELGNRVHLKAAPLVRLTVHPGLLIEEDILTFRLGIDPCSDGWPKLREELTECAYEGIASDCFPRWWARAVEDWWFEKVGAEVPLAGCSVLQRVEHLSRRFSDIAPLQMPKGSMGDRPWRYCLLELLPVGLSLDHGGVRDPGVIPWWTDHMEDRHGPSLVVGPARAGDRCH